MTVNRLGAAGLITLAWAVAWTGCFVGGVPGGPSAIAKALGHLPTVLLLWSVADALWRRWGRPGRPWSRALLTLGLTTGGFAALTLGLWRRSDYPLRGLALFGLLATLGVGLWESSAAAPLRMRGERRAAGALERLRAGLDAALGRGVLGERRWAPVVLAAGVVLLAGSAAWVWYRAGGAECTLDCYERFDSFYISSLNRHRFGWQADWGLMDMGVAADPAEHPRLYTHSFNALLVLIAAAFEAGVRTVEGQAALAFVFYAAGMGYLYAFVTRATRSPLLGALALVAAGTLYPLTTLWAFHVLWAPAWLLTFGPAWHLHRSVDARRGRGPGHVAVALLGVALSSSLQYPTLVAQVVHLYMLARTGVIAIRPRRLAALLVLTVGGVFLVHQGLIIGAVGLGPWAEDFRAIVARRVPLAAAILPVGLGGEPEQVAHQTVIQHGAGKGSLDPVEWLATLAGAHARVVGWPLLAVGAAWLAAVMLGRLTPAGRRSESGEGHAMRTMLRLTGAQFAGVGVSLAVFPWFVYTLHGVHLMPLPVHGIILLLAGVGYLAWAHARAGLRVAGRWVPIGGVALASLLGWRLAAEWRNHQAFPPRSLPAVEALRALQGHSFVTTTYGLGVTIFTHEWAATLTRRGFRNLLQPEPRPFDPGGDYFMFVRYVRNAENPAFRYPQFLLVAGTLPVGQCRPWRPGPAWANPVPGGPGCDVAAADVLLGHLPLVTSGSDFRVYDLRPLWRKAVSWRPTPDPS